MDSRAGDGGVYRGQSVFDVLLATVKAQAIHMEYQNTPMYETAYIEGIGNLYEFDCGALGLDVPGERMVPPITGAAGMPCRQAT